MNIQDKILKFAKEHKKFQTRDLSAHFGGKYTRQYISKVLGDLINSGVLVKDGSTKKSFYALPENANNLGDSLVLRLKNKNLEEDRVFEKIQNEFPLVRRLPENVHSILYYAFSEMMNNAIEHSRSEMIEIKLFNRGGSFVFEIRDFGIGVFRNIMQKRKLKSETEAIQDLLKGKQTTAPKAHSGEGIFFTSKIADVFDLESFEFALKIDNKIDDIFVIDLPRAKKGTRVVFEIEIDSKKHLSGLFEKYQTEPDTYAFDKTTIKIKLYLLGTIYISRSQARRVLAGLDKFKSVTLDFEKVPTIGQAFADEVFRVFQHAHPDIEIKFINANKAVNFMIKRALKTER